MAMTRQELRAKVDAAIAAVEAQKKAIGAKLEILRLTLSVLDKFDDNLTDAIAAWIDQGVEINSGIADEGGEAGGAETKPENEPRSKSAYSGTHYERIVQFFVRHGNTPSTNMEIRDEIGLDRGAVAVVLYQKNSAFVKAPKDEGKKIRWQMRQEEFEAALNLKSTTLFEGE